MMKTTEIDKLKIKIYESRNEMGKAAAKDIKECILKLLA